MFVLVVNLLVDVTPSKVRVTEKHRKFISNKEINVTSLDIPEAGYRTVRSNRSYRNTTNEYVTFLGQS